MTDILSEEFWDEFKRRMVEEISKMPKPKALRVATKVKVLKKITKRKAA